MTERKSLPQISKKFNLTRALIVRSRLNAGDSLQDIAFGFRADGKRIDPSALSRANQTLSKYIKLGLIKESDLHKHEDK